MRHPNEALRLTAALLLRGACHVRVEHGRPYAGTGATAG